MLKTRCGFYYDEVKGKSKVKIKSYVEAKINTREKLQADIASTNLNRPDYVAK